MTGLSRAKLSGEQEMVLVCDRCGASERAEGLQVRDFVMLWRAVEPAGWHGRPRPIGPHYCPTCARRNSPD